MIITEHKADIPIDFYGLSILFRLNIQNTMTWKTMSGSPEYQEDLVKLILTTLTTSSYHQLSKNCLNIYMTIL